jgi:antitoxin (DNA-binding transcriptional repressor) of toxin-antitoxin stability system
VPCSPAAGEGRAFRSFERTVCVHPPFSLLTAIPDSRSSGDVIIASKAKDVIRISESEAAHNSAGLIKRVRAGAEVIIENGEQPAAVLRAAGPAPRSISECIALAERHEEETGKAPVLDVDFAKDVEEILSRRKPWKPVVSGAVEGQS